MCDAAKELKKCWEPKAGDRFYLKNDLYVVDYGWEGLSVVPQDDRTPYYYEGVHYLDRERSFGKIMIHDDCHWDKETMRKHSFWLPRQGELQELLRRTMGKNSALIINFKQFTFSHGRLIDKYSMDALWLMFYYYEIHSKIWNGEEFEKVEKNLIGVWS